MGLAQLPVLVSYLSYLISYSLLFVTAPYTAPANKGVFCFHLQLANHWLSSSMQPAQFNLHNWVYFCIKLTSVIFSRRLIIWICLNRLTGPPLLFHSIFNTHNFLSILCQYSNFKIAKLSQFLKYDICLYELFHDNNI